jgi:hypothetical protein
MKESSVHGNKLFVVRRRPTEMSDRNHPLHTIVTPLFCIALPTWAPFCAEVKRPSATHASQHSFCRHKCLLLNVGGGVVVALVWN